MERKVYFYLSQCYNCFKSKRERCLEMVIKKSQNLHDSSCNVESSKVPRSVCDTERDRRQHKDPLKEEELQ